MRVGWTRPGRGTPRQRGRPSVVQRARSPPRRPPDRSRRSRRFPR